MAAPTQGQLVSLKAAGPLAAKGPADRSRQRSLIVESPGGGGLGDPLTRPAETVRADVAAG